MNIHYEYAIEANDYRVTADALGLHDGAQAAHAFAATVPGGVVVCRRIEIGPWEASESTADPLSVEYRRAAQVVERAGRTS